MRKTIKLFSLMATLALAMVTNMVWADAAPAATPAPTPVVTVNGLVDTYISYNFANSNAGSNGAGNVGTFFNTADNSFSLGLAEVDVNVVMGQTSGHISLDYGQEGNLGLASVNLLTGAVSPGIDLLQAYVSYNPGEWTFNAGRFMTWMGNEVIQSKSNWNYSRSLLFWYTIPLWHQGLSVAFNTSDSKFGITGYATDGWNNTAAPTANASHINFGKTYGLQSTFKPDSTLGFTLNGIAGPDAGSSALVSGNARYVGELIVSFAPNSTWSFAVDGEYGATDLSGPATLTAGTVINSLPFWGVDVYGRYQIASDWAVALRLEQVVDSYNSFGILGGGGPTGAGLEGASPMYATANVYDVTADEGTLTIEHNFSSNLLMRLEGRMDMVSSGGTAFSTTTTPAGPFAGGVGSQVTGTASMVFSF